MGKFQGFIESETLTAIPDSLFGQLLSEISSPDELKVVLFALWRIGHMEGSVRVLRVIDFDSKQMGLSPAEVTSGLEKAVARGVLLASGEGSTLAYFLNSPRGRAAAAAWAAGKPIPSAMTGPLQQTNVFKLYEENIGPLTPLIAETLKAAEEDYPETWIAESIQLAVTNNKRSWTYCAAILKRWKEEGRAQKQNRRDNKAARQRDVEEKIKKFLDR